MNQRALTHGPVRARRGINKALLMGTLLMLLGLGGCDSAKVAELEEGVATEADVRARFGEPDKVWMASDMASLPLPPSGSAAAVPGARTFEYSRQPQGSTNYLITVGPDGKMTALRQVLSPDNFARVRPGMPMEVVRKMLGRPMKVTPYALAGTTHYDWRYIDPPNTPMVFTAVFDRDLHVVSTNAALEESVNPGAAR
jgi:hypothetical protein